MLEPSGADSDMPLFIPVNDLQNPSARKVAGAGEFVDHARCHIEPPSFENHGYNGEPR